MPHAPHPIVLRVPAVANTSHALDARVTPQRRRNQLTDSSAVKALILAASFCVCFTISWPKAMAVATRRPSSTLLWSPPSEEVELERPPDLLGGPDSHLQIARFKNFFSPDEMRAVHMAASDPGAWEVDDRGGEVTYLHQVWRIEAVLQSSFPQLYEKITDAAWAVDRLVWNNIGEFVFPEIEYIAYDVEVLGAPGKFGKHTDNDSLVTMVVLLADVADFEGGLNCFASRPKCRVPLSQGDALFFYGDRCEHWITPVESGRRVVLQMELRRSQDAAKRRAASGGRKRRRR